LYTYVNNLVELFQCAIYVFNLLDVSLVVIVVIYELCWQDFSFYSSA